MQTKKKIALGSDPMRTKIEIGQTHVPKRAKHEIELKRSPDTNSLHTILHESDQNSEQHNPRNGRGGKRDRGEGHGRERDKKRDRDRVVEISEKSHKANDDGRWLLMSVELNGGCCRLWWWIHGVHVVR